MVPMATTVKDSRSQGNIIRAFLGSGPEGGDALYNRGILSVRTSVCPSVRPSVRSVHLARLLAPLTRLLGSPAGLLGPPARLLGLPTRLLGPLAKLLGPLARLLIQVRPSKHEGIAPFEAAALLISKI